MTLWNKLKLVLDFQNSYNFFISFLFVGLMSFVILKWTQTRIESRMEEKNMTQSVISDDQFLTIRLLVLTITNALHWEKNTSTQHRWILIFDFMLRPKHMTWIFMWNSRKLCNLLEFRILCSVVTIPFSIFYRWQICDSNWSIRNYYGMSVYVCVCMVFFCLVQQVFDFDLRLRSHAFAVSIDTTVRNATQTTEIRRQCAESDIKSNITYSN